MQYKDFDVQLSLHVSKTCSTISGAIRRRPNSIGYPLQSDQPAQGTFAYPATLLCIDHLTSSMAGFFQSKAVPKPSDGSLDAQTPAQAVRAMLMRTSNRAIVARRNPGATAIGLSTPVKANVSGKPPFNCVRCTSLDAGGILLYFARE
jgi:hypothetical protein